MSESSNLPRQTFTLKISHDKQTWLLSIGFILLWNSGFIGAEYALPNTRPLTLLFWRYWLLTGLLFLYLALCRRLIWPGVKATLITFLVGILAHGVWLGCVFYSLEYGVPAGIIALVVALQPMATATLSGLVTGERIPLMGWLGLLIGFNGVVVAVLGRTDLTDMDSAFAFFIPFGSVAAITVASLIQRRRELKKTGYRLTWDVNLFFQSLGVALIVTIPAILFEGLTVEWTPLFIGSMLWLIVGVSLAAYALMWLLITRINATRVASLFYFGPPVTMVMAWITFGDEILATDLIAIGIIAGGVLLAQMKKLPSMGNDSSSAPFQRSGKQ